MRRRRSLGRRFTWLWTAYTISAYGTGFGFGAISIIAIRVLHCGPGQVSLLASVGLAAGALLAIPLGPWVEFRRKRPVMIGMDLIRFGAQITIPIAYLLGWLGFVQLLLVAIVVAGAKIAFQAASGSHLTAVVRPEDLLVANARFESTTWSSLVLGPPAGGAAIGLFGATASVTADAISYLLSALGIRMITGAEPTPPPPDQRRAGWRDLPDSWRYILTHRGLRGPFFNRLLVGSLIMCTQPLLAVLMLDELHFEPWQFGVAFAAPCVGGLIAARLSPGLVARLGQYRVMLTFGTLTVGWPIGLAFIPAGTPGLLIVIGLQLGLVINMGILNPVVATYRLEQTAPERITRTLSAWSVSTSAMTALMTALWGLLAELVGLRTAIAAAGLLALPTPLFFYKRRIAFAAPVALGDLGAASGAAVEAHSVARENRAVDIESSPEVVGEIARLRGVIDRAAAASELALTGGPSASEVDDQCPLAAEHRELRRQLAAVRERVALAEDRNDGPRALRAELATLLFFARTLEADINRWRSTLGTRISELERQSAAARRERERMAAERERLLRCRDALQLRIVQTAARLAHRGAGECRRTLPVSELGDGLAVCSVSVSCPRRGLRLAKRWLVTLNPSRDDVVVRRD